MSEARTETNSNWSRSFDRSPVVCSSLTGATELIPGSQVDWQTTHCPPIHAPSHQPKLPGLVCPPKAETASAKHSNKLAVINLIRFIGDSLLEREARARRLIQLADFGYMTRQNHALELAGQTLCRIPGYEAIGAYYYGQAGLTPGYDDPERAKRYLERAASRATGFYQARALLQMGVAASIEGDRQAEFEFYRQALKYRPDVFTSIEANRAIAIILSREGNHKGALELLRSLWPVVSACRNARLQSDYLNSLACELGEAGEVEKAIRFIEIALRSPYAKICPEYQQTHDELVRQQGEAQPLAIARPKADIYEDDTKPPTSYPEPTISIPVLIITNPILERLTICYRAHAPPAILS